MTAPQRPTITSRPTLDLLGSDHPHFRVGARVAAQVTRGRLTRLAIYAVHAITIDRRHGRVVIQTAQEYLFVTTIASYDALLAAPQARSIPRQLYTDRVSRWHVVGALWRGLAGTEGLL